MRYNKSPIQLRSYHKTFLLDSTSRIQTHAPDFETLDVLQHSDLGTCPRVSSTRLTQIFEGRVTPDMFNNIWDRKRLTIWMILFVLDIDHKLTGLPDPALGLPNRSVSSLMWDSYMTYKDYCRDLLNDERPRATLNIRARQDICPVVAVLTNNDAGGYGVNEFCAEHNFGSFPLILTIDEGIPTRQHVGRVTVDAMREFLDRVPSAGQKVY